MEEEFRRLNDSMTKISLFKRWSFKNAVEGVGIHPKHMPLLNYIKMHPGCTQVEISYDMGLTPAAITLATQKLQKNGYIRKTADPENLRCNVLDLTDAGRRIWDKTHEVFYSLDEKEFNGFTADELSQLQSYFNRIMRNLSGKDPEEMSFKELAKLKHSICDKERKTDIVCED